MTVTEYRRKYPDCKYCQNRLPGFEICNATNKSIIFNKRTAKKCPCYVPEKWKYENVDEA